jgi:hypothetical protein
MQMPPSHREKKTCEGVKGITIIAEFAVWRMEVLSQQQFQRQEEKRDLSSYSFSMSLRKSYQRRPSPITLRLLNSTLVKKSA